MMRSENFSFGFTKDVGKFVILGVLWQLLVIKTNRNTNNKSQRWISSRDYKRT